MGLNVPAGVANPAYSFVTNANRGITHSTNRTARSLSSAFSRWSVGTMQKTDPHRHGDIVKADTGREDKKSLLSSLYRCFFSRERSGISVYKTGVFIVPTLWRGNASGDALRPHRWSGAGCIPTLGRGNDANLGLYSKCSILLPPLERGNEAIRKYNIANLC